MVDDNPTVRKLICKPFTRELDFAVCGQAQNGRDALIQAQELRLNLSVTDLNMPFMNGPEETNAFKTLMPCVPIILYSADMDRFVEQKSFAAGASAAIQKTDVVANLIPTLLAGKSCHLKRRRQPATYCLTSKQSNQTDFRSRCMQNRTG